MCQSPVPMLFDAPTVHSREATDRRSIDGSDRAVGGKVVHTGALVIR